METPQEETHAEILRLLEENNSLLKENHRLVRKIYRNDMIGFAFKLLWFAILIGLPFAVYFYVLEPYFQAFGANYETFRLGIAEIPGLKWLEHLLLVMSE
jgi:hypothetical protein